MKDIRQRLQAAFEVEHREHLAAIRKLLPATTEPIALVREADLVEICRRAHSLKGAARAVDLRPIETLAHRLETLFIRLQKKETILDGTLLGVIHQTLDYIEDLAVAGGTTPLPPDLSALDLVLTAALPKPEGRVDEKNVATTGDARHATRPTDHAPSPETPRKSPHGSLIIGAPTPLPSPTDGHGPHREKNANDAEVSPAPSTTAPVTPPTASDPESAAPIPSLPVVMASEETVRIPAASLDQLLRTSGELTAELAQHSGLIGPQMRGLQSTLRDTLHDLEQFRRINRLALRQAAATPSLARIVPHLEATATQVGRLTHLSTEIGKASERGTWTLRQLAERLQADVQKARMVPAEHLFGGFRKMVRDLARDQGKRVDVQVQGLEVEADRLVLQMLKDPVMHVLRNAVSHGIEPPSERTEHGKSAEAHIRMDLVARGGRLVVTVSDDGRGINYQRIVEVAIARGLLSAATAPTASREFLHRLLLRPGFSTATTVDTLSGRGVGLSVLHEAVTRLGGGLELRTSPSGGTQVEVSAPLTVSFQHLLLVTCRGQVYGLPSYTVDHLYRLSPKEVVTVEGRPALAMTDQSVPLIALSRLLGGTEVVDVGHSGSLWVVLLRVGERRLAIVVDTLLQVRECLLNDPLKGSDRSVLGTFLLDTGTVAFALDPTVLAETLAEEGGTGLRLPATGPTAPAPRTILVVDDSVTTRTLEKGILETRGFRVRLAVDGQNALDELRRLPADLVISDVEMPRMNGLALLQTLKQDPSLRKIPVILVTSHDHPDEIQHGLDLGADAYIVKHRFDQDELLATIEQLL
ncbi:Histidine kinase [Gammaproteobacteria bacterium]